MVLLKFYSFNFEKTIQPTQQQINFNNCMLMERPAQIQLKKNVLLLSGQIIQIIF